MIHDKILATAALLASLATDHAVCVNENWAVYTDHDYQVTIGIPPGWKRSTTIYKDRPYFEGREGSFQINASEGTLKQACKGPATHPLKPYGEHPQIRPIKINGQNACLIWPSEDQGPHADAEVMVEYPRPIKIVTPVDQPAPVKQIEGVYSLLELVGDKDHILPIARTVRFQISK